MKIIISGSEGFLGKRLRNELIKKNADVEVVGLDIVNGYDLCKIETLDDIPSFDLFIHLAALSYVPDSFKYPKRFYDVNINGTLNALELCRKHNAKMIFISSYVYGNPEYLPIDENHPLKAFNPYAQSKIIGEKLCEGYYRDFGVGCTILRPFNIYGEGQNGSFLLPSIINQIKLGEKEIKLMDPNPRRDFIHIHDVVRAIVMSVESLHKSEPKLNQYNIAFGKSYSVREITELILSIDTELQKVKFTFNTENIRKNEVNETVGSNDRIKKEIGWEPSISLKNGLKEWLSVK